MEMIANGTIRALMEGIHNPPMVENEAPFPAEHHGTMEFSIEELNKKASFAFQMDFSDSETDAMVSIREATKADGPFVQIMPYQGRMCTPKETAFIILFSQLLDTLQEVWDRAAANGTFYEELQITARWEMGEKALPLLEPVFQDPTVQ